MSLNHDETSMSITKDCTSIITVFGITISWMSVSLNYDETLTANEYNQKLYICTVFGIAVWWMSGSLNSGET